ncbi:Beta-lactamase-like protein str6 [Psilocybe cubensis]|uniref:Beta-lactamase-like protein str6 n=2 Tax=Psilocybe cubensis TaxID=181762 RepID=A0ACB8HER8_PSICU|nr:Beta-lactamase-like protein str6 [Psilocybe cubensis]KAH9486520.1 Beta-lactamase-like protein str6 [Psilocybe cubensis]
MGQTEKTAVGVSSPQCARNCVSGSQRPACSGSLKQRLAWVCSFLLTVALLRYISLFDGPYPLSLPESSLFNNAMTWPWTKKNICQPPSPNLFAYHPPRPSTDLIEKAAKDLDEYLTKRASEPEIDSISLSIVTPAGPIFIGGYGTLRANETDLEGPVQVVDENSIYRIASISKMFTVLETLILREKGLLNWDDPVAKFVANISLPAESYGWANYLKGAKSNGGEPRISLRQLASHMAGIGRDYPPIDIGKWPISPEEFPSYTASQSWDTNATFDAITRLPLVNVPYTYPIYSNTGFGLLGLANIGADSLQKPASLQRTHAELLKRDVFEPLGMTNSFFRLPESEKQRAHIAVPAKNSEWADIWMGDFMDPVGGQYSSLKDLSLLMKTLLSPTGARGVLPASVVREWLRPIHIWGTGGEHVGAPWEAQTLAGVTAYAKGGNLPGYHSEFALVPEYSFGIVLLVSGSNADTVTLLKETAKRYVPAFEKLHEAELRRRFQGKWISERESKSEDAPESAKDVAEVTVKNGALHLTKLNIDGKDVLQILELAMSGGGGGGRAVSGAALQAKPNAKGGGPVVLWPTGRTGEFRMALGRPELNKVPEIGCIPYWISLDFGAQSHGVPLDLVYWERGNLHYPSAGITFERS